MSIVATKARSARPQVGAAAKKTKAVEKKPDASSTKHKIVDASNKGFESSEGELEAFDAGFCFDAEADIAIFAPDAVYREDSTLVQDDQKSSLEKTIEEVRREAQKVPDLPDTVREKGSEHYSGEDSDASEEESADAPNDASAEERKRNYFDDSFKEDAPTYDSFESFEISKPLLKALSVMGLRHPTPIQQAAIPVALMGRDICGGAETGSGKTAAFLVPVIERLLRVPKRSTTMRIRVVILLPTRELAVQCVEVARKLTAFCNGAIRVSLAAGGMPMRAQEAEVRTRPDIIVATPGRLIDHTTNTPGFSLDDIEVLILDEADRMLEEGFRAELEEIIRHCPGPEHRQSMLFSASMTDDVDELARLSLKKPVRLFVDARHAIARRLEQEFVRVRNDAAMDEPARLALLLALAERVVAKEGKRCIVFLPTKELAHRCRVILGLAGLRAVELHGGMEQAGRLDALLRFRRFEADFLVATDVAARGLDIPSVDCVLNHSMPANYNQYLHRVGRTARAGQSGQSITLVGEADRKLLKLVMRNSTVPVKQRSIPSAVHEAYRSRLSQLSADIEQVLACEHKDKLLDKAQREADRASNLLKHAAEIKSRPKKTWFLNERAKKKDSSVQSKSTGDGIVTGKRGKKQNKAVEKGDRVKAKRRMHRQRNEDN